MADREFVRLERDGAVSTLTLDRPDRLNALDQQILSELSDALDEVGGCTATRCLIVTGAGRAFVAGADISAMLEMSPQQAQEFAELGHRTFDKVEALAVPAIAAINGFALGGGCELALACDFAYASEKARLGQPEVKLGVIPGFGGTQRLMRRLGAARARELIYSGVAIGAEDALRIGLVNAVFPPDRLMEETRKTADAIAAMGPKAVAAAKRVILEGADLPLSRANAVEIEAFARLFTTADRSEGMTAFLEKREARFEGK